MAHCCRSLPLLLTTALTAAAAHYCRSLLLLTDAIHCLHTPKVSHLNQAIFFSIALYALTISLFSRFKMWKKDKVVPDSASNIEKQVFRYHHFLQIKSCN